MRMRRQHRRVALFQRTRGFNWCEAPRRRGDVGVHPERQREVRSTEFLLVLQTFARRRHLHHQRGASYGVDSPHADFRGEGIPLPAPARQRAPTKARRRFSTVS